MDKWNQYEHLTDLYKSYLGTMVNLGAFSFAAIGGVSSLIVSGDLKGIEKLAIAMPLLFSFGLTIIYFRSITPARELNDALQELGSEMEVKLTPHAYLLVNGVTLLALLYAVITIGLACYAWLQLWA